MPPQATESDVPRHSPERYRGKNLLFLLLAIGVPGAFLYLRLVFEYAAAEGRFTSAPSGGLLWAGNVALGGFFVAQLISARYVQGMFKRPATWPGNALQYVGVLLLCGLFSATGAVLLEAFGYALLLRVKGSRY